MKKLLVLTAVALLLLAGSAQAAQRIDLLTPGVWSQVLASANTQIAAADFTSGAVNVAGADKISFYISLGRDSFTDSMNVHLDVQGSWNASTWVQLNVSALDTWTGGPNSTASTDTTQLRDWAATSVLDDSTKGMPYIRLVFDSAAATGDTLDLTSVVAVVTRYNEE